MVKFKHMECRIDYNDESVDLDLEIGGVIPVPKKFAKEIIKAIKDSELKSSQDNKN